jgi:hypothetical protein
LKKKFGFSGLIILCLVLLGCSPYSVDTAEDDPTLEAAAPSPDMGLYIPNLDVTPEHWGEYLDYHAPLAREVVGLAQGIDRLSESLGQILNDVGDENTAAMLESSFTEPINILKASVDEYPMARYETVVYYQEFFSGCLSRLDSAFASALLLGFEGGSARKETYDANKADLDLCLNQLSDLRGSIEYTLQWDAAN